MEPNLVCPLCNNGQCKRVTFSPGNAAKYDCQYCGKFSMTAEALAALGSNGWKLAAYVKERNLRAMEPRLFATLAEIPAVPTPTDVTLDDALSLFPKSVPERLDGALLNLAAQTRHLGGHVSILAGNANPILFAQNNTEAFFVLQEFEAAGFIKGNTRSLSTEVSLTAGGLNRVADLQRGLFGPHNKQVFVAMSFDRSLDAAWKDGFKIGIEDSHYSPLRMDAKEHNEKICDLIIAEIKKSKFLVADFTLHRQGVYFEAGLMMGLGRPVIFTCREDDADNAHFDTRQYNHIRWQTPDDLRQKLKRRIEATITA